jgi:Peptidase family S41
MKHLLLILIFVIPRLVFSQDCDCASTYNWVKKTIEENDAGFSYVIDSKGQKAYEIHCEAIRNRVKTISDQTECALVLKEYLAFIRSGHLSIKKISTENKTAEKPDKNKIIEQYKDWERLDVDIAVFEQHHQSKKNIDFEGIWKKKGFKIGIKKIDNNYLGFIIEADEVYWAEGQIKLKIDSKNKITYYNNDRSTNSFFDKAELIGNNYLQIGFSFLERINPIPENNPTIEEYIKTTKVRKPYFEKIDEKTNLLRIPTFYGAKTKIYIDSVISANKEVILKTPNLIIDIRNNGGGSDRSFREVLPFIYTNPIRQVGIEFLSTPLNNQRMLDFINDPKWGFDEEEKEWAQDSYDILVKQIGEFVNIDSVDVNIITFDTVFSYPKNVGIIINEYVGSSGEEFLYIAKQSKKVKLFGTTTMGVLDISNMYSVKSPCEKFELGYSLSRSMRIPELIIDDIGFQPDYYIDKSIPKYEWIEFVSNILKD